MCLGLWTRSGASLVPHRQFCWLKFQLCDLISLFEGSFSPGSGRIHCFEQSRGAVLSSQKKRYQIFCNGLVSKDAVTCAVGRMAAHSWRWSMAAHSRRWRFQMVKGLQRPCSPPGLTVEESNNKSDVSTRSCVNIHTTSWWWRSVAEKVLAKWPLST